LELVSDLGEEFFPYNREETYRLWHQGSKYADKVYFPVDVERAVTRLLRKGLVKKEEVASGLKITLTENGKKQVLMYKLADFLPKSGKWDGKWRVVFFDISDNQRKVRNTLRRYLEQLGFRQYQESVYVSPYDCDGEVKYLREVLNIADDVKLGIIEKIENEEDLKKWFKV